MILWSIYFTFIKSPSMCSPLFTTKTTDTTHLLSVLKHQNKIWSWLLDFHAAAVRHWRLDTGTPRWYHLGLRPLWDATPLVRCHVLSEMPRPLWDATPLVRCHAHSEMPHALWDATPFVNAISEMLEVYSLIRSWHGHEHPIFDSSWQGSTTEIKKSAWPFNFKQQNVNSNVF